MPHKSRECESTLRLVSVNNLTLNAVVQKPIHAVCLSSCHHCVESTFATCDSQTSETAIQRDHHLLGFSSLHRVYAFSQHRPGHHPSRYLKQQTLVKPSLPLFICKQQATSSVSARPSPSPTHSRHRYRLYIPRFRLFISAI